MKLDFETLTKDVYSKLKQEKLTHVKGAEKIGVSTSAFFYIKEGENIKTATLLKLVNWLNKPIENYIIK